MALDHDIRILSAVRLFQGFTQEQLRLLAFGAETTLLQANHKLYREDDEADTAYVVVSGRIVLYREQSGERIPIGTAGPGTMLSELALIADTNRLTSASAEIDSEVIRLSRKMFRRILEEYPEVAVKLHQRISEEFQDMIRRIEELAPRFSGR
ncbi:cyclic nucleotide-binding domain-containing protein [Mesorhizobium sp. WSM4310]|uniref:Crp/Fnr family transcriptional regulator n=1 Tax=Mesorhizobium sp. WSM4310 TaxID=2589883 RepID=UPI00115EC8B8|nr:cyclic nucleotide-binding domain-containing protein [Mesorhizobium sp. WSM4310]TRC76625.1 cyclic nucleotide-binding domain-containing protein [Mesorhizobium sp. WSM4310]